MTKEKTIEICRSYSRKKNLGDFENVDFFCSLKAEVAEKDIETTSKELHNKCRKIVDKEFEEYAKVKLPTPEENLKGAELWETRKKQIFPPEPELPTVKV